MNSSKLSYRAEIDGLRAIAVVSVILYHAQMVFFGRDWFKGGFIGVDIFFVISGYLITRIILFELQSEGSFNFLNFYERRARRILPMLFVVIFISIPYAWQRLLPSDFVEFAESIIASLFFGSNFFFYFSTTEYGADSALLKPFLHTWSLGVEEQFYLVFPILAIVTFKFFRKFFLIILLGLSLLSLQFAEFMDVRNSDLNFYLPFSRFWELAVGSILAYRELNFKPTDDGVWTKMLPMLGLYMIAHSILLFDGKTPHPSFHTLIPIIGVAFIIGFASKDELVGRVLGSKPFVWLGLISYSAYLWHFPIFAFSRMGNDIFTFPRMAKEPSNYDKFGWVALAFFLSFLSYIFVEKIFRNKNIIGVKLFYTLLSFTFFITFILFFYAINYFKLENTEDRALIHLDSMLDVGGYLYAWHVDRVNIYEKEGGFDNSNRKKVLVVGNSHGTDYFRVLLSSSLTDRNDFGVVKTTHFDRENYQVWCLYNFLNNGDATCKKFTYNDLSLKLDQTDTVILATRWTNNDIKLLSMLIEKLHYIGKKVIVVGNAFEMNLGETDLPIRQFIRQKKSYPNQQELVEIGSKVFRLRNSSKLIRINSKLKEISNMKGAIFIDREGLYCDFSNSTCKVLTNHGHLIVWDYGHLSINGARYIGQKMDVSIFKGLL